MFKKLKAIKKHPLFPYISGENNKNIFLLILTLFPGVLAGLMEGFSYISILLAVNVLRGEQMNSLPFFNFFISLVKDLSQNRQFLIFIILALFVQIIRSSLLFLAQYIVSRLSIKITTKLQCKIYKQIFNFSYPFVSKYEAGDLINYNSSPSIVPAVLAQFNIAFSSLILGLISLAFLIKIDFILTIILLGIFFLVNSMYKLILKKMSNLSLNLTAEEVKLSKLSNQNMNAIKLIHLFQKQNYIVDSTKNILTKIASATSRVIFWRTLIISFGEIIGIIVIALMLVFGAFLLHHKGAFMSYLLMFIFIAYRFSARLQVFMTCVGDISTYKGALTRLKDIIKDEDKEYAPQSGQEIKNFTKDIKFKNIEFQYPTRKAYALENFSFNFEKGKTYAIVGKSGSGKSTLIDLLLNLYKPTKGSIIVDNINLNEISLKSWRNKIGVVNQDIFLFHNTIEDNIKFANENASLKSIKKASELANAHEFIEELPQKYNTIVGEKGHKLSGGERQRIALARALVKDPDILILDEATSHLDTHSEKLIQKAIETLRQEKTIIIIAHRLSTIVNADEILVINNGTLIESGSHEKLLNMNGQYAYFWNIQSKTTNTIDAKKNIFEKTENLF